MKLTKYGHACFTVESDGKLIIVDPGVWSTDLPALESVVGVFITHEHADHFDVNALGAIIAHNPDAVVYAHETITRQFGDTLSHHAVDAGDSVDTESFSLQFVGGKHAVIHPDTPVPANLGVIINHAVYYPGDSFFLPDIPVDVLALPIGAPWLKIQETIDFVRAVKPRLAFPTHDAILSDTGKLLLDTMLPSFISPRQTKYQRLKEPLEIAPIQRQ